MFDIIILFVVCVIIYKLLAKLNFSNIFSNAIKTTSKARGEELTLMTKKCEICGEKTIYLKGDESASSLKPINIVNPDSGEVITKLACDKCYEELMSFMKQEKNTNVTLSPELKALAELIKNS